MISAPRTRPLLLFAALALLSWAAWAPGVADSQRRAPRCSVESSGLRFGAYNVFDIAPMDAVGTVLVQCEALDPGTQIVIGLGRGSERHFHSRALRHRRYSLGYQIYLDAARTLVWGDGTGGTSVMRARPSDDRPVSIPMFGRVPPRQNVGPGDYGDQLVITVDY